MTLKIRVLQRSMHWRSPIFELGTKFFSDQSCVLVINMFWRQFREQSENGQNWWKMAIFSTFCPLGTGCGTWYETFFWWILCFGYIHVLVAKTVSRTVSKRAKRVEIAIFSTFCPLGTGGGTWYETFFWWILCFGYKHVLVAKTVSRTVSKRTKGWKWPFLALFAPWGPEVELGTKHFSDESCVLVINMFWWQRQFRGRSQNGQKGGNDHF